MLSVRISPDGKKIVSSGGDSTVKAWDTWPPATATLPSKATQFGVGGVFFVISPHSRKVIIGCDDSIVN